MTEPTKPRIAITYCTQCNWLLRSAWMAQELLSTFGTDLGAVALVPATGGAFSIAYDGDVLWERVRDGGFPDVKALKTRVRDRLDPGRDLGHVDRTAARRSGGSAVDHPGNHPGASDEHGTGPDGGKRS